MRLALARALLVILLLTLSGAARGGFTGPTLVLVDAAGAAADGVRSVLVTGSFELPNALEAGLPLALVVFQGDRFARYPFNGTPAVGPSASLADGQLTADEVDAFMRDGSAAPPGVRIAGSTTALVLAILDDGGVLSNPIGFSLP